jgi:hypothetical protein
MFLFEIIVQHMQEVFMALINSDTVEKFYENGNASEIPYAILCELKEESKKHSVMCCWLAHPETKETELNSFLNASKENANLAFLKAAAENASASAEQLSEIYHLGGDYVAEALASHANTPERIMLKLIDSGDMNVLVRMAKNESTPVSALKILTSVEQGKDARLSMALSEHPTLRENGPFELIRTTDFVAQKNIALHMSLSNDEIAKLWTLGGVVKQSLVVNPKLSPSTIDKLASIADVQTLSYIAQNQSMSEKTLVALSQHDDNAVRRGVALNRSTPSEVLHRLVSDRRGDVAGGVAENPCATISMLLMLSRHTSDHVRESVARHDNVDEDILVFLSEDKSANVRKAVALNPLTPLTQLRKLASDRVSSVSSSVMKNPEMGIVSSLKGYAPMLKDNAYGAFNFYQLASPKKTLQMIIGSKHPEEMRFVFDIGHCDAFKAISALQSAFTNNKGKIDRDGYLTTLKHINDSIPKTYRLGLSVECEYLALTLKHFSVNLLLQIVAQNEPDEARDCFRMLSTLLSFDNKQTLREHRDGVLAWLENPSGSFHDYLVKKTRNLHLNPNIKFYQASLLEFIPESLSVLDKGWEVNWPTNSIELLAIGDAQHHCVGGRYYADRCIEGSSVIFQIMPENNSRHGYTFQFSRNGTLLQAKGFANSHVPQSFVTKAKEIFRHVMIESKKGIFETRVA